MKTLFSIFIYLIYQKQVFKLLQNIVLNEASENTVFLIFHHISKICQLRGNFVGNPIMVIDLVSKSYPV